MFVSVVAVAVAVGVAEADAAASEVATASVLVCSSPIWISACCSFSFVWTVGSTASTGSSTTTLSVEVLIVISDSSDIETGIVVKGGVVSKKLVYVLSSTVEPVNTVFASTTAVPVALLFSVSELAVNTPLVLATTIIKHSRMKTMDREPNRIPMANAVPGKLTWK
ncbi:hypothetical protein WICPIJ_008085 [Wickerhamomyces pijperi]|uniref:Secreted protein n=1 Tax=Wickerhamomyces pijperi TaxID=599730 RepID=A0A9P8PZ65_WICPI|nr:hypothetical protein WICPIJ_008085 [Wickerhamomyces pijperi]